MSTVHVALLKAIIDQGPESNNYYTISIVLIAISLILQVLAGLLSLIISKIRSFYTNHRYVHEIYDCDLQIFFKMNGHGVTAGYLPICLCLHRVNVYEEICISGCCRPVPEKDGMLYKQLQDNEYWKTISW